MVGLKRYAQPAIWYDTWYDAHDTIRSAIHLPFLPGKQRLVIPACDQKHCTPPTTTACAVMMRSGYNNGGLLGVSRCSVFVMNSLILLEYTDCFLWYLVFVSNFGMCYICTVSYRIVLRAYRDTYRSLCIGDIRCAGVSFQPHVMEHLNCHAICETLLKIFKGTVNFLCCVHKVNLIIFPNVLKQLCRAFYQIII